MRKRDNAVCTFCSTERKTTEHLFWPFYVTSSFILDVELALLGKQFVFSKEDIFFGYKLLQTHPYNFLIYHLKFFIFQAKLNCEAPNVPKFLQNFKFKLQVEKLLQERTKSSFIPYVKLISVFQACTMLSLLPTFMYRNATTSIFVCFVRKNAVY